MHSAWLSVLESEYEAVIGFTSIGDITHVILPNTNAGLCGRDLGRVFVTDSITVYNGASDIKVCMVRIRKEGKHLCMECWDALTGIEEAMKGVKDGFRQTVSRNDRENERERLVRAERRNNGRTGDRVCKEIFVAEREVDNCEAYRGSITITTIGGEE